MLAPINKKLKVVFINMSDKRTFPLKNSEIGYRIKYKSREQFGMMTHFTRTDDHQTDFSLHVISRRFLIKYGAEQKFRSPHGRNFDDNYSYLEGMNFLTIKAFTVVHFYIAINFLQRKFKNSKIPIDRPKLGVIVPEWKKNDSWIQYLQVLNQQIDVSTNLSSLFYSKTNDNFIDYSLSRGYKYTLSDYSSFLEQLIRILDQLSSN